MQASSSPLYHSVFLVVASFSISSSLPPLLFIFFSFFYFLSFSPPLCSGPFQLMSFPTLSFILPVFYLFSLFELTACLLGKEGLFDANRSNRLHSAHTHTHSHQSQKQLISQDVDTTQGHRTAPVGTVLMIASDPFFYYVSAYL